MTFELTDIIARLENDAAAFVAECEERYTAQVEQAAERILHQIQHNRIILLSGPSGSSKTTTSKRVAEALRRAGVQAHHIALDNYYKTIEPETAPRTPEGDIDYESPDCLDIELLNRHFDMLEAGEEILIPHFNFSFQRREEHRFTPLRLGKNDVAIFEGIHALSPAFTNEHPGALKVYVSPESVIRDQGREVITGAQLRLVRRLIRDDLFRGADPAFTLGMWHNIARGEVLSILPFKPSADLVIDTVLPYEPGVFRPFIGHLLGSVPETTRNYPLLREALRCFSAYPPVDLALVPKDSILREFLGGSVFDY